MAPINLPKLIHLARILPQGDPNPSYLYLRQVEKDQFSWFDREANITNAPVAKTVAMALSQAHKHWKHQSFRTVNCGFRYTLPERDEHGMNALYYQMVASYSSSNGIYYDDEVGFNCIVQFASQEALSLWHQI